MVLIIKGGGEYRGIGLVELIWNFRASIMNNRLRSAINLHDALHGFRQGREAGTMTTEANMAQQLAGIFHEPLFQVFIDVRKAYESLDKGRCTDILRGYGPRLLIPFLKLLSFHPKRNRSYSNYRSYGNRQEFLFL